MKKSRWIIEKIEYFRKMPRRKIAPHGSRQNFLRLKDQALALVKNRIEHFNKTYNFTFNRITIRNQKTRWGSCSRKGNINFNYKIALLPQALADYIIVHELCHLRELNHSKKFWELVAREIPDHRARRKELRKSSLSL